MDGLLPHHPITSDVVLSNLKTGFCMTVLITILFAVMWVIKDQYLYIFLLMMFVGIYCNIREYRRYKKMKIDEKSEKGE